jgi:hypothetical protein
MATWQMYGPSEVRYHMVASTRQKGGGGPHIHTPALSISSNFLQAAFLEVRVPNEATRSRRP